MKKRNRDSEIGRMVSSGERQKRPTGRRKISKWKEVKSERQRKNLWSHGRYFESMQEVQEGERKKKGAEAKVRNPLQCFSSFLDRNHSKKYISQHDSVHTHTLLQYHIHMYVN